MIILVLGNSSIFKRKVYPALKKFKKLSIELATRSKITQNYKSIKTYDSYENALKQTKAKVVYISLVNSQHYYWAIKSLEYNKHIIIDKPLTLQLDETLKLLSLAKKKKLFISEAIVFHYHKQFKEILSKINLKKKAHITTHFYIPKLDKTNFRNNFKLGGGCFQDMSSYASYMVKIFFKNKKFFFKKIKHSYIKKNSNSFSIIVKSDNITLNSSFSFNNSYKNYMIINLDNVKYKVDYIFSPPINQNLVVNVFNKNTKKKIKINFKAQNTFYTYFNIVFNIIEKKNYSFFYNEIKKTAKIKNEII